MATIELPQLVQRLVLDASGVKRGAAEAEASFNKATNASEATGASATKTAASWNKAASSLSDTGKKMTTFITLPLVGIAAAAVKTAGEFDQTMRTMAAVAGVPGPELKKLGELAKQMGRDTVFSANDAAESMLNLSKAGISAADIAGGALQATLSLAAAGGLDLGNAAVIAANAMHTFGLEGRDAGKIADALAGAANASSADVSDLAMALSQGGLAAHAAGLSIEETTAVLAAFADAGLRGSDAGTSLKTFLLNLVPNTKAATNAMADLGLKFTDLAGNMLPISNISEQLRLKTKDLSAEQKTLALQTIFGTDAYRAALVLSEQGAAGLDKYRSATSKVGTAAEVADARMKGWAGTWEQFKGSVETAALSIGQVIIPAITPLVDKVKDLADAFSGLTVKQQEFATKAGLIAAASGPALVATGKLGKGVGALASALGTTPPMVLLVIAAVAAMGVAFALAWKNSEKFRDTVTEAWGRIVPFVTGLWEGQLKPIFEDFQRIVVAIGPLLKVAFIGIGAVIATQLVSAALVFKGALEGAHQALQAFASVAETVGRNLGPIWGGIEKAASTLWQVVQTAWNGITGVVLAGWAVIQSTWGGIQTAWDGITGLANVLWRAVRTAWDGIAAAVSASWTVVSGVWQAMVSVLTTVLTPPFLLFRAEVQDGWEIISSIISTAWNDVIQPVWRAMVGVVNDTLIPAFRFVRDVATAAWNDIAAGISAAWNNVILPAWNAMTGFISDVLSVAFTTFTGVADATWGAVSSAISTAWGVVQPILSSIADFVSGSLSTAFSTFRDVVSEVWGVFESAAQTAWDNVGGIIRGSLGAVGTVVNGFLRVVANIADVVGLDHIAGVLRDGADAAAGWGALASGGALGAPGRVGSGFVTDGPRAIVGEGKRAYPEVVIPTDPAHRQRASGLWAFAGSKMNLMEDGGILGSITGAIGDVVGAAIDEVKKLAKAGLSLAWPKLGVQNNLGGIVPASFNAIRGGALNAIGMEAGGVLRHELNAFGQPEDIFYPQGWSPPPGGEWQTEIKPDGGTERIYYPDGFVQGGNQTKILPSAPSWGPLPAAVQATPKKPAAYGGRSLPSTGGGGDVERLAEYIATVLRDGILLRMEIDGRTFAEATADEMTRAQTDGRRGRTRS